MYVDERFEYARLLSEIRDMSEKTRIRRRQISGMEAMVAREREQLDSDRREIKRRRKVADRLNVRLARSNEVTQ